MATDGIHRSASNGLHHKGYCSRVQSLAHHHVVDCIIGLTEARPGMTVNEPQSAQSLTSRVFHARTRWPRV